MKPFDLVLGAGTKIVREQATIVPTDPPVGCLTPPGITQWWLIQQTIHTSCVVATSIASPKRCARCDTAMPDPDAGAAEYILANHDGNRIVSPFPTDVLKAHPERDTYPVDGWVSLFGSVICSTCNYAFTNLMQRKTP